MKRTLQKWNNPDAAIVMQAIDSLRFLLYIAIFISVSSLALNSMRTYLVSTQINKLQAENLALLKKGCK